MPFPLFYEQLTAAERRVLPYCIADVSCKSIAGILSISIETVKTHRKNIAHKLGVCGKEEFRRALHRLEREGGLPPNQQLTPNSP